MAIYLGMNDYVLPIFSGAPLFATSGAAPQRPALHRLLRLQARSVGLLQAKRPRGSNTITGAQEGINSRGNMTDTCDTLVNIPF